MVEDLVTEAATVGLVLHADKTKVLTNGISPEVRQRSMGVHKQTVEILQGNESTMYLGRLLNLRTTHDTEFKHRISKAWGKFAVYKDALTDKNISLHRRLRLLNSVITPSILYGSCTWALTKTDEDKLRST